MAVTILWKERGGREKNRRMKDTIFLSILSHKGKICCWKKQSDDTIDTANSGHTLLLLLKVTVDENSRMTFIDSRRLVHLSARTALSFLYMKLFKP